MLNQKKPKILLHICCAGCGAYIGRLLKEDNEVTLYYYNPNIFPEEEYANRLAEVEKVSKEFDLPIIIEKYDHNSWLNKIKGYENEPEKGRRCLICYRDRLEKTAETAKKKNFDSFTTTLTVSPYKLANEIFKVGNELAGKLGLGFLEKDFKKEDGFKKASALSRELGLYRQNYCGCEFSRRP